MKKHLIASAVALSVAGPVMAQNVSVYGVLDTGYTDIERKVAGSVNAGKEGVVFNSLVSSRFGLRGSEDLGGGMKAGFVVETGISGNARGGLERNLYNVNGNVVGNGSTVDATVVGDRGLFATLELGQGTTVRVGFGSTPLRDMTIAYSVNGASNNVGETLGNDANFAASRLTGLQVSHKVGNITGTAALYRNNDEDVAAGVDQQTNSGYGVAVQYAAGPLSIGFSRLNLSFQQPAFAAGAQISGAGAVTGVNPAAIVAFDGDRSFQIVGASYDLGPAKLFAQFGSAKLVNELVVNEAGEGKYSNSTVGISVPLGATTAMASWSSGSDKRVATQGTAENRSTGGYFFGVQHAMSKRTSLYAVSGKTVTDVGAGLAATETILRQTSVGLVHTF